MLDKRGDPIQYRALLDCGSQINLITNSFRSRLGLNPERSEAPFTVAGVAQMTSLGTSHIEYQADKSIVKTSATVVRGKITQTLNAVSFQTPSHLPKAKLADPNFNQSAEVDMFFGAQLYESLRRGKTVEHAGLHLVETVFGYGTGLVKGNDVIHPSPIVNHIMHQDNHLQKNWETEKTAMPKRKLFTDEEITEHNDEKILSKTLRIVGKTLKDRSEPPQTVQSFHRRIRVFRISRISSKGVKRQWLLKPFYLPHHAVMKESSTTTKLRVVIDGSAKPTTGNSLNDTPMVVLTIQPDLFHLLVRFQHDKVGLTADFANMYQQIGLSSTAKPIHRIVRRNDAR